MLVSRCDVIVTITMSVSPFTLLTFVGREVTSSTSPTIRLRPVGVYMWYIPSVYVCVKVCRTAAETELTRVSQGSCCLCRGCDQHPSNPRGGIFSRGVCCNAVYTHLCAPARLLYHPHVHLDSHLLSPSLVPHLNSSLPSPSFTLIHPRLHLHPHPHPHSHPPTHTPTTAGCLRGGLCPVRPRHPEGPVGYCRPGAIPLSANAGENDVDPHQLDAEAFSR